MALQPSPVKRLAEASGIEVFQPPTLKDAAAQEDRGSPGGRDGRRGLWPDRAAGCARYAALRLHQYPCLAAAALARAALIQRALLAGDHETGVSIMQMEAGLDSGPVLLRAAVCPIGAADNVATLHDRLAERGRS